MFSEKDVVLRLPQLDVRFPADSNSWNANGTPNQSCACEADARKYYARVDFWQCSCTA